MNEEGELVDKEYVILVQKVSTYDITFDITPEGATLLLDGEIEDYSNPFKFQPGTRHTWSVTKEGYVTQNGEFTVTKSETITVNLEPVTETSWSDLVLKQSDTSENPINAVPKSGGKISLKASVTVHFNDGSTEVKDVTSQAEWLTLGNGCTSDGGGVFTWAENPAASKRSSLITANVTGPDSSSLSETIQTVQLGANSGSIDLIPNTLSFGSAGSTETLEVNSDSSWTLTWEEDESGGGEEEDTETLSIVPDTLTFDSPSDTKTVQVLSNTTWTIK